MRPIRKQGKADRELEAIGIILGALEGLDGESIQRVLDYVIGRLSISRATRVLPSAASGAPSTHATGESAQQLRRTSIRDLKECTSSRLSYQLWIRVPLSP